MINTRNVCTLLKMGNWKSVFTVMIFALFLVGCAAQELAKSKAFPPPLTAIAVKFDAHQHEMENGVEAQIPNTQVFARAPAKIQYPDMPGAGPNLVALFLNRAASREAADSYIQGLPPLSMDLNALVKDTLSDRVVLETNGKLQFSTAPNELTLSPAAMLPSQDGVTSGLYLAVWATLRNGGRDIWSSRYIFHACDMLPISGANGWATDDWKSLRTSLESGSKTLVDVIIKDTNGPEPWTGTPIEFEAPLFPFGFDFPGRGELLSEQGNIRVIRVVSTLGNGGVNIYCDKDLKPPRVKEAR